MPKKSSGSKLLKALRNADDICRITTGRRLNEVVARGIEFFGDGFMNHVPGSAAVDPAEMERRLPYMVLGVNYEAPDSVVKAAYKAIMKECHPDSSTPDADKARRVNSAYDQVCKERGIPK
jgi:DnaJ-domain-containing protein 1